jgi:ATP-dependent Zn protease
LVVQLQDQSKERTTVAFVTEQYKRAQELLRTHQSALKTLAQQLLKLETVSGSMVKEALENSPSPGPPADAGHLEVSFQTAS